MIVELLRHLLLRCPPHLKRLGVLHDLIALEHRARRQRRAWAPHHQQCQQAITAMLDHGGFGPRNKGGCAVILGSGLLLDLPLERLRDSFEQVIGVDLYHLPAVRKRARQHGLTLVSHDITGLLAGLPASLRGALPTPQADLGPATEADFVLSANCLSQLAGVPLAVADAVGGQRPDHLVEWERAILRSHLDALLACRGAVGLISDSRREVWHIRRNELQDWVDLSHGVAWPALSDEQMWWWELAPPPEEGLFLSVRHRVHAGLVKARAACVKPNAGTLL